MSLKRKLGIRQLLASIGMLTVLALIPSYGLKKLPIQTQTQKIQQLLDHQKIEEAITLYLSLIDAQPFSDEVPQLLMKVGDLYNFSLNQPAKASQTYQRIAVLYPTTDWAFKALLKKAELFFATESYDEALRAYQTLLFNFPNHPNRWLYRYQLGVCHLRLKQFEAARKEFKRILEADLTLPLVDQVLFQTANSYLLQNRQRQAIAIYEAILFHFPKSMIREEVRFNLADCYESIGEFDQALEIYRAIQESYPNPKVVELKIQKNQERRVEAQKFKIKIEEEKRKNQLAKYSFPPLKNNLKDPFNEEKNIPKKPPKPARPKYYRINLDEFFKEQGVE